MSQATSSNTIFQRRWWADVLFWFTYTLLTQLAFAPEPFSAINLSIMLIFLAGELTAVYGHLRFGLRPLLQKERGLNSYLPILLGSLVIGILVFWAGIALLGALFVPELSATVSADRFFGYWVGRIGWSTGSLLAISSGLHLYSYRRQQAQRERELEMAKTQAELSYLRGQLNPHFLFNALNNIYILIGRDTELAQESLLGFSDLLRYQLYASEAERVPLSEEIDQLRKFAALSRLRMEEDFTFRLDVPAKCDRQIPPMLLLPLVENAFKYSSREGGFVHAELTTTLYKTRFTIRNRIGEITASPKGAGGIGLQNLRRRLDLLYAGTASMDVRQEREVFTVNIELPYA